MDYACIYRIFQALELNLRAQPRKLLVRNKPEPLSMPQTINTVLSMDSMHDQLGGGKNFRLFNVIDEFNRRLFRSFAH